MVSPAVSTPTTTPDSNGGSNPAPAGDEKPGSGAPPQSAAEPVVPPAPGQGDQAPADGGTPPAPEGNATPAPQLANNEPERLTPQQWEERRQAQERLDARANWDKETKELHSNANVMMRDALDALSDETDTKFPTELRKPILDLVKNLVDRGTTGAELKYKETVAELEDTLEATSLAFLRACKTPEMRQKFVSGVKGKDPDVWVDTMLALQEPEFVAKAAEGHSSAQALLLPEGATRDAYTAKVKGESDPKKIAQAFHDALVGVVGPKGEPQVASRGPGGGDYKTMREVRAAHARREITTPQMRDYQARNQAGTLPD